MHKIVYVQHSTDFVGAPTSLLFLLQGLDKLKFSSCVLFTSDGPIIDLYRSQNVEVRVEIGLPVFGHTVPGRSKFQSIRPWQPITGWFRILLGVSRYKRILKSLDPDIIHINSAVIPSAALAAKYLKIPVVWHVREQLYHGLFGVRQRIFRKLIECTADQIIALSEASRNQFSKIDKIKVIYNFVDFQSFNRAISGQLIRESLNIPCSAKVIGFMGGALPHKGGLILLDAMKYIYKDFPETHLIVLGNTSKPSLSTSSNKRHVRSIIEKLLNVPTMDRFFSLLKTIPGRPNIHLVGAQKNIPEWIAACDVIVVPSTEDHFARPIIEAGAMAKPVVVSDWPSTREIVAPGSTGLLVTPSNPPALASAIITLLVDTEKSERMGEAGYQQALNKFSAPKQVIAVTRIYNDILLTKKQSD